MKKVIGKISWMIAVIGVLAIVLATSMIDSYILFYVGSGMLIMGIAGTWITNEKTKEMIWKLLDFM